MPKHARKRQKTSQAKGSHVDQPSPNKAARLEKLLDEESKDDEERRLESLLFGVKYVPKGEDKGKHKETIMNHDEDSSGDEMDDQGGRGLRHLLDQDIFFIDDGPLSDPNPFPVQELSSQKELLPPKKSRTKKKSAWIDPSEVQPTALVSLLSGPTRLRKLRHGVDEDIITGKDYETRLRAQFERVNPEPAWAKKAHDQMEEDEEEEDVNDIKTSTTGILNDKTKSKERGAVVIPSGTLSIERVRDANQSVQNSGSGEVRVLSFHPKPDVPVLCVATADRRVRLFNIDGHLSPLLTTLHLPSLPLTSPTSVLFHPQGNSMLLSGPRPFFFTYDLQQGTSTMHRRGLWGSGDIFDDSAVVGVGRRRKRAGENGASGGGSTPSTITHTAFSPCTGSLLAVAGRGGVVHLVDWKSGAGQVVGSLTCTSGGGGGGGGIQGLWWVPGDGKDIALGNENGSGTGDDEKHLAVLTGEAEVYIWDVGQRRCVKRWKDEGGYRGAGRVLAGSGRVGSGWMAIGSSSGFVNVYGSDSFAMHHGDNFFSSNGTNPSATGSPKLVKALGHLTTPISTLRFNHDAQILAMASRDKKDAMRLIHLPSLTSFGNWPTSSTPLGHVTAVDFSARSEYVAVGNTRGRVLLYHLKEYGSGR
ncbi:WD40 repeat-like protein [Phlegmacium glaucopus]|nr:WD40 repeat-like protein [Phlegmacium glaucopus]